MYTEITSLGLNFIEHTYYMIFDFILNMFSLFFRYVLFMVIVVGIC